MTDGMEFWFLELMVDGTVHYTRGNEYILVEDTDAIYIFFALRMAGGLSAGVDEGEDDVRLRLGGLCCVL